MAYEIEVIRQSQRIFYYLLKHHELAEEKEEGLYRLYCEEEEVMNLVKSQAEMAECAVEKYGNTVYLIPRVENDFLGFSKNTLKQKLCKSGATDQDYYLSQFVIMTLLMSFYQSQGHSSKSRDYMRGGELLNVVADKLEQGAKYMKHEEEKEERGGIAYTNMIQRFNALRSTDGTSRAKTTKEGFIHTILTFLEEQKLIIYIEQDDMIKTTKKLDHFMDWNLLNKNNYERVKMIFEEVNRHE